MTSDIAMDRFDIVNLDVDIDFDFEPVQSAVAAPVSANQQYSKPNSTEPLPLPTPRQYSTSHPFNTDQGATSYRRSVPLQASVAGSSGVATRKKNAVTTSSPRTRSPVPIANTNTNTTTTPTTITANERGAPASSPRTRTSSHHNTPGTTPPAPSVINSTRSRSPSSSVALHGQTLPPSSSAIPQQLDAPTVETSTSLADVCASITWVEATKVLRIDQADVWKMRTTHPQFERISVDGAKKGGIFSCCLNLFDYDITESSPHWDERDFLLGLAQTPFAYNTNSVHRRMLMSVWRLLQGEYYSSRGPADALGLVAQPLRSLQWVLLGFSDADPTSDFRHVGVFGLHQLLFLTQHRSQLATALLRLSRSKTHRFPLGQVAMAFSGVVVQLLKDCRLNNLIREASETTDPRNAVLSAFVAGSVDATSVLNALYTGLWFRFHEVWSGVAMRQPTETATPLLRDLMRDVRKSPKTFVGFDRSAQDFLKMHRTDSAPSKQAPALPNANPSKKGTFYALS